MRLESEIVNSREIVKDGYNKIAQTYQDWSTHSEEENTTRNIYLKRLYQLVQDKKKDKDKKIRILDIGCGSGLWTKQIKDNIPHSTIVGIDISETQIQLAENNNQQDIQYICQDIMMVDYPSNHFDIIIGFFSIIHLSQDDQSILLPKLYQWLNNDNDNGYGLLLLNLSPHLHPCIIDQNWLGAKMFWSSLGESTYKQILKDQLGFHLLDWDIVDEKEDDRIIPFLWAICEKKSEKEKKEQ